MNFPWVVKRVYEDCKNICTHVLLSECHHTMMHIGSSLPMDQVKLEIELQTEVPLIMGTNEMPGRSRTI